MPVRLIHGKSKRCREHQEQYQTHRKKLDARRRMESDAPKGRDLEEPFTPQRLMGLHPREVIVDPAWATDVALRLERAQQTRRQAQSALSGSPGRLELAAEVQSLILALDQATATLRELAQAVRVADGPVRRPPSP